jgi:HD domain
VLAQKPAERTPAVSYTEMGKGTREEYMVLNQLAQPFKSHLADRVLAHMQLLHDSYPGERVDRYVHSLQTATRAHRHGADEETVVAALLHDIGDMLAQDNQTRDLPGLLLLPPLRHEPEPASRVPRSSRLREGDSVLRVGSGIIRPELRDAADRRLHANGAPDLRSRALGGAHEDLNRASVAPAPWPRARSGRLPQGVPGEPEMLTENF